MLTLIDGGAAYFGSRRTVVEGLRVVAGEKVLTDEKLDTNPDTAEPRYATEAFMESLIPSYARSIVLTHPD